MFRRHAHNFLHARRLPRPESGSARAARVGRNILLGFGLLAAVIAVVVLPFWFISERVYSHAESGKRELLGVQQGVARFDFDGALLHVDAALEEFGIAQEELSKLESLSTLPYVGPHVRAADHLLVSGSATASAVQDVLRIARDIVAIARESEGLSGSLAGSIPDLSVLFKDLTPEKKRQMLATFARSAPDIEEAIGKIDGAIVSFDGIPGDELAGAFKAQLAPLRARLILLRDGLASFLPVARIAPGVLGHPSEKNYLFFFQNNTELRPTGGFLGVFGALTVRDAEIASIVTNDVYALDGPSESHPRPAPPAPIRKYIGIDKWYLRDANWSPDFTVSAEVMERFYREEAAVVYGAGNVPDIDAIVTVTPTFAVDILRIVGPVTVDGKTFTPENFVDELQFEVEKGFVSEGIPVSQRKDIVGKLLQEVVRKTSSLPVLSLLEMLDVVERNLDEGHILLSMKDPELQAMILAKDWGGKLKPVRGDYLTVIDANLASLKSDPVVQRTIRYVITPEKDGSYIGRVIVTYDHKGTFTWKTTRYRTYTRVYVPAGARLLSVAGALENDKLKDPGQRPGTPDAGEELGRSVFGAFISIEPGQRRSLEFRFALAPSVAEAIKAGRYRLDVEKQPGTEAHGLTLDLDFGKKLTNAAPAEDRSEWGDSRFRLGTDLRIDRSFEVQF